MFFSLCNITYVAVTGNVVIDTAIVAICSIIYAAIGIAVAAGTIVAGIAAAKSNFTVGMTRIARDVDYQSHLRHAFDCCDRHRPTGPSTGNKPDAALGSSSSSPSFVCGCRSKVYFDTL